MLKPVHKTSLSDAVFLQLRDQILSGRLAPGETLPAERALCEMLDTGRGAVREALKRLEQARLVSIQHGGATEVLDFRRMAGLDLLSALLITPEGRIDFKVARSAIEMRSVLAPDITRLAALRGGAALAGRLDQVLVRMEQATGDLPALQELALEFWNHLVEGCENVAYRLAFNSMRETYEKFAHLLTQVLADELADLESYAAIAAAVRAGEAAAAAARARALIERGAARIVGLLQALDNMTGSMKGTDR